MKDSERDQLRKTILQTIQQGHARWTALKKRVLGSCQPWATDATFRRQMNYLLGAGCIRRINHGNYVLTVKGEKYLEVLVRN